MNTIINQVVRRLSDARALFKSHARIFRRGYREFLRTGYTSEDAYQAMVTLYCRTNGRFLEETHKLIAAANPPRYSDENCSGVLGCISRKEFDSYNSTMNKDGYVFFSRKLPAEQVARLTQFAINSPARIPGSDTLHMYDKSAPMAEIYRIRATDLMSNPDIQELVMDPTLIALARHYLECEPIFDFPAMWWSTSISQEASSEAAQLYHFDLDRIKWLKLFIYLTDVSEETGPHRYIRGTHVAGAKPPSLLKRGYARIPDADLAACYPIDDFKVVCGEAGTMFAGDTKCWHKGTPLKFGHRLVLEFEYTSSLFGANTRSDVVGASDKFKEFCKQNPNYAANLRLL